MRALVIAMLLGGCGVTDMTGAGAAPTARGPTTGQPAHGVGSRVSLVLDAKQVDIGLGEVPHEDGRVALKDLWNAGMPTEDPLLLHFDLIDVKGFRLGSHPACAPLLNGTELLAAHMDVETHDVTYDRDLPMPACYRMQAVMRIVATR